jgi:hypothetical protein
VLSKCYAGADVMKQGGGNSGNLEVAGSGLVCGRGTILEVARGEIVAGAVSSGSSSSGGFSGRTWFQLGVSGGFSWRWILVED